MAKKAKGKPLAEGEEPPKKDNKKKIIIVVALAAAWKMGFLPIGGSKDAAAVTTTTAMWPGDAVAIGDPLVVNLADETTTAYARVGIALVLPGHGVRPGSEDEAHALTLPVTTGIQLDASQTVLAAALPVVPGGFGGGRVGAPQVVMPAPDQGSGAVDPIVALEKKFPRMRAAATDIVRAHTSEELLAEDGIAELEAELTEAALEIFGSNDIYGVEVTDLVIQE